MSERNGAKLYLQLTAYELGQLLTLLPSKVYEQMDPRLRKKIQSARDQVALDAIVEDGIREIEKDSAAFSTRYGGDPLSRYDYLNESVEEENISEESDEVLPDRPAARRPGRPRRVDVTTDRPALDI